MLNRIKKAVKRIQDNRQERKNKRIRDHRIIAVAIAATKDTVYRNSALSGAPVDRERTTPAADPDTVHAVNNTEFDRVLAGRSNRKIVVISHGKIVNFQGPMAQC